MAKRTKPALTPAAFPEGIGRKATVLGGVAVAAAAYQEWTVALIAGGIYTLANLVEKWLDR